MERIEITHLAHDEEYHFIFAPSQLEQAISVLCKWADDPTIAFDSVDAFRLATIFRGMAAAKLPRMSYVPRGRIEDVRLFKEGE
jgi:hypothetical protein